MDFGQRNQFNSKCYGCKYVMASIGRTFYCGNKYTCIDNNKWKEKEKMVRQKNA